MDRIKKRVTLKEIANITGFSISTVSKSFNENSEISKSTRAKVNKIAKVLGYQPNKAALTLRSGKNYTIAVVIPSIEDPFYARIFHGIQSVVTNTNYSIITCITRESFDEEVKIIDKVFSQVDAFIIAASEETFVKQDFKHLEFIISQKKSLIIIDRRIESLKCSKVLSNSFMAIKDFAGQALAEGYKKIVLVSCSESVNDKWKIQGFRQALEERNIEEKYQFIIQSKENQIEKNLMCLIKKENIDCIIAIDDQASFVSLRVAKKMNKKIPKNLAIVGYMSEKIAQSLDVQLTTINQHRKTIGIEAMNLVLNELNPLFNKTIQNINIESTLVRRASF